MLILIITGILVVGGVFVFGVTTPVQADDLGGKIECSDCGNNCNQDVNCGRASCGAVTGGSCSCGK